MAVCVVVVDAPECPLFATVAAINSYSNHSVAAHFDRESLEETHTVMETRQEEVSGHVRAPPSTPGASDPSRTPFDRMP